MSLRNAAFRSKEQALKEIRARAAEVDKQMRAVKADVSDRQGKMGQSDCRTSAEPLFL